MPDTVQPGTIRTETDCRIFRIVVDNVAKRNAFTPAMMSELSEAFTAFDRNDELWVAVLAFAGEHTTAGLDMPKFFGPNRERRDNPADNVDPFALRRRTMKPVVAAVQGLCLTVGIGFGIVPAWHSASADANVNLKDGAGSRGGSRHQQRWMAMMTVSQIALSVILLSGTGLLVRSVLKMYELSVGVATPRVIVMQLPLPGFDKLLRAGEGKILRTLTAIMKQGEQPEHRAEPDRTRDHRCR